MRHEIGNARGWSSAPGCASLGSCGSRARGAEALPAGVAAPAAEPPPGPGGAGAAPAGPRRESGSEREGSGTMLTPLCCLHGLLRGPAGGTKAA